MFGSGGLGTSNNTAFGAPTNNSGFGVATGAFGATNPSSTTGAFGSPSQPMQSSPFGVQSQGTTSFGQGAQTSFGGLSSTSPFGQPQQGGTFGLGGQGQTNNQGTAVAAFTPTQDRDQTTGLMNYFQTITAMPQYKQFSVEELRVADYQQNRKSADVNTGFGQITNSFGQSAPTGGFGQSTPTGGGFGQSAPAGGGFGQSAPAGGVFGQGASTGGVFGQGASTGGGFGQSAPTGGFGQSTPTGGGFGSTAGGGFGSSSSAAGGNKSAFQNFFGQPSGTNAFGQPQQGALTFGSQPPAPSSSFGAKPSGGLFGATNSTAPATSPFGSKPTTGGFSFGQPIASTAPSAFNQTTTATNSPFGGGGGFGKPATGLFGGTTQNTALATPSFGGFGAASASQPAGGSAFGGQTISQPSSSFAFGGQTTSQPTRFGSNALTTSQPTTGFGSAFGVAPGQPATSTGNTGFSAFGSSTGTSGGLFGQPATTGSFFGNNTAQTNNVSLPTLGGSTSFGVSNATKSASVDKDPYGSNPLFDTSKVPATGAASSAQTGFTATASGQKINAAPNYPTTPRVASKIKMRGFTFDSMKTTAGKAGEKAVSSLANLDDGAVLDPKSNDARYMRNTLGSQRVSSDDIKDILSRPA